MSKKQTRRKNRPPSAPAAANAPRAAAVSAATPRAALLARWPLKAVAWRVLAAVLGLIVALFVAELGLRAFGIRPERYPPPRWFAWDGSAWREWGMWGRGLIKQPSRFAAQGVNMGEYVPGARFKTVFASNPRGYFDPDGGVLSEVNSLGLRGPEIAKEKPPGTFRILGLGDSFTFGVGVRDKDTFLRQLETLLNAQAAGGTHYEVLNAGVQGYNTRDEVLYLEHRWMELDPDLVLITFYLNDAYSDSTFLNMGQAQGIDLPPQDLGRYSYLVDLAQHAYHARQRRQFADEYYRKPYFAKASEFLAQPGDKAVDWNVCRGALAHAVELCRGRRIGIALVIFPELHQLDERYPFMPIHELVLSTAASLQLPALDLLKVFRGQRDRDLWAHPSDHHPNNKAHRQVAEAIEKFLRSQGLLAGLRSSP